ncbi:MAG: hypothetical protein K2X27_12070 [Candidatus Obscuribacterales bacterium]|nr:hypothetical protein [Candidatus Obscuribacterales bacterium]
MAFLNGGVEYKWTLISGSFIISAIAYYVSYENFSEEQLATLLSIALVLNTSLFGPLTAASAGSHYALLLSLSILSSYSNRRLLALASLFAVLEQSFLSVICPSWIFPSAAHCTLNSLIEHLSWLAGAGGLLLLFCENRGLPLYFESSKEQTGLSRAPAAAGLEDLFKMAEELGERSRRLHKTISNIDGPLKRMVQSINGANRGMQEIKDELSRTAASVIQITQSSEMHAKKAKAVFQAAEEAAYGSQVGALSSEQNIRNMERIHEQMDSIAERMDNLLTKSQLMVQVVGFADELALQSKVLSVNAAIEAAKAGDRGEGFSAVAREVKSLAIQSKDATRQVRQILREIQKSIADVRRSIAQGNETVDLASNQCRSTVESIKSMDESVNSSRDAAEAIMNSSKDQVMGIMQISHAMNDIQSVSEQNFGSLGNLQIEAQKLNTIARELIGEMKTYQGLVDQLLSHCSGLGAKNTEEQK